ncbi:MAG: glycosyltransferase [Bacteroides sp.]|nr:glycosyltransferase [Bacteroides sp.]
MEKPSEQDSQQKPRIYRQGRSKNIGMKRICICGAFRLGKKPKGGQEIKTVILADALEAEFGKIYKIDTLAANSTFKIPFQLLWAMAFCPDIIILPAQNGIVVLSRLLVLLNKLFHRKLHYSVIGGWLQDILENKPATLAALKKFTGIYVETQTMKNAMSSLGLENVYVVPNCKPLSIISQETIFKEYKEPYKLVTFSRVTEKKGIGTAVETVNALNEKYGREVFQLDIYGPVDQEDEIWFENLKNTFTPSIFYKGNIPFDRSVETLRPYFALLFPTQYFTEGIPGTIIDSYTAGVPVIASRWKSASDVVEDGISGFVYEFGDKLALESILERIVANPNMIVQLKGNCLRKAEDYLPQKALKPIFNNISN